MRVLLMLLISACLSVLGMCIGSLIGGGHALGLLRGYFPVVLTIHAMGNMTGLIGLLVAVAAAFVFTWNSTFWLRVFMAALCIAAWAAIALPLDGSYIK
jgi:hypothetical protein